MEFTPINHTARRFGDPRLHADRANKHSLTEHYAQLVRPFTPNIVHGRSYRNPVYSLMFKGDIFTVVVVLRGKFHTEHQCALRKLGGVGVRRRGYVMRWRTILSLMGAHGLCSRNSPSLRSGAVDFSKSEGIWLYELFAVLEGFDVAFWP